MSGHTEKIVLSTMSQGDLTIDRQFTVVHFVLGIEANGTQVNASHIPHDPRWTGLPIEEIELEVPQIFGERLASFYERYFLNPTQGDRFNCHRFALWMLGSAEVDHAGDLTASSTVQETLRTGRPIDAPLGLGQMGVIGTETKRLFRRGFKPLHSVIGLGDEESTRECIHVQGADGPLLLSSLASARDPYREAATFMQRHVNHVAELYVKASNN